MLDALGLVVFAIFGTRVALEMGHPLSIAIASAVITGVFSGVMRDLLCNRVPLVFRKELYASIAVPASLVYGGVGRVGVPELWVVIATLVIGFTVRMVAIRFQLGLPVSDYQAVEYRPIGRRRVHPWSGRPSATED